jgi:lactate dehydrogenase-like 2-hydroxyacid dehydrogenase
MKILLPDAQPPDAHALEAEAAAPIEVEVARARSLDELPPALVASADAIVGYHVMRYDAAFAAAAERCRILVRAGSGTDNVDLAAWRARGIPVCNVPDYGTSEIADHAIALLLALARGFPEYLGRVAEDAARRWGPSPFPATVRRLRGSRLLIVGLGRVGAAVATRARAMGMTVLCFSPRASEEDVAAAGAERYADLHAALAASDCVSLHLALRTETARLVDRAAVAAMKPGMLFVNTARGGLVDEAALLDGLRSGRIAGAALDVLGHEPPDRDHPLVRAARGADPALAGRVIVTPHAAWASPDAMRDMRVGAVTIARDFLLGGPARNCVNGF